MRRISSLQIGLWVLGAAFVGGCATYHGPVSPYISHYEDVFASVQLPSADSIDNEGVGWTLPRSIEDVWEACMRVTTQYEGILKLDRETDGSRRLLFVHGQGMPLKTPPFYRHAGMIFTKFIDTWVAVHVRSEAAGATTVTAAWVSPETGKVTRTSATGESENHGGPLEQPPMVASYASFASHLSDERSAIDPEIRKLAKKKKYSRYWEVMPRATINQFFQELSTQLLGSDSWQAKFISDGPGPNPRPGVLVAAKSKKAKKKYRYADLERRAGNFWSANIRTMSVVVSSPAVEELLHDVVRRLLAAAGEPKRKTHVYIVASPEVNAGVLPNGDVFVYSGLLDAMDNVDELAAVLGHELDHLIQHATVERLKNIRRAEATAMTLMIVGSVAGAWVSAEMALAAASATTVPSSSAALSSAMLNTAVSQSIVAVGGVMGQVARSAMVEGYSKRTELRADANGAKYMYAAGYDPLAELSLLAKLKQIKARAEERHEQISSSFVNCKPGPDKRIKKMKETLRKLGALGGEVEE